MYTVKNQAIQNIRKLSDFGFLKASDREGSGPFALPHRSIPQLILAAFH